MDIELERQRGDAVHTRELASALGNLGLDVCLVTSTSNSSVPDMGPRVTHRARPNVSDIGLSLWLTRLAIEFGAEVVYERRFSPKIGCAVKALARIPLVVEINGLVDEERSLQRQAPPLAPRAVRTWWHRRLLRSAEGIVAVTTGIRDVLIADYDVSAQRIYVVPNGANTRLFQALDRRECRARLGLGDAPLVVFVGELAPWQGVDALVRAAGLLEERYPGAVVLIVGDGIDRDRTQSFAKELEAPVRFEGRVPYEKVPLYLGAADVVVVPKLPLRSGYSPLKVYEALASGRVVIASRLPGFEFVEIERVGVLVRSGDPPALANAMAELLGNNDLRAEMESRARPLAVREFSWNRTAERVLDAIEAVRLR